jgi:hypothetical protein
VPINMQKTECRGRGHRGEDAGHGMHRVRGPESQGIQGSVC